MVTPDVPAVNPIPQPMSLKPIPSQHPGPPQLLPDISVTPLDHLLSVLSALLSSLLDFI